MKGDEKLFWRAGAFGAGPSQQSIKSAGEFHGITTIYSGDPEMPN